MNFASILSMLKIAWPIISFVISLLSGLHAASAHAAAAAHVPGTDTVSAQATHVLGAGGLAGAAFLAGTAGVVSNHRAAASAPSKAPEGVDPVLHQYDVTHSALVAAGASDAEFDGLNALIKARKNRPKVGLATDTRNTA
jgi:hypothetical protein